MSYTSAFLKLGNLSHIIKNLHMRINQYLIPNHKNCLKVVTSTKLKNWERSFKSNSIWPNAAKLAAMLHTEFLLR